MKNILILSIILGVALSTPCFAQGLSVRKLAEYEEYQGHFHLAGNGFVSVSDKKVVTYYVWDNAPSSFKKTDDASRVFSLDLPTLKQHHNEQTQYSFDISNPALEGMVVVQLVIVPQKHPSKYDPNRDFYLEVLLNGKHVFKSEMMNGVVEKFLGADVTDDSAHEIVLQYAGVGGSGFTTYFVVFQVGPETQQ
jgi:hypothetical protein